MYKEVAATLALAALAGCATASAGGAPSEGGRVWPAPPEPARVRHVRSLSSERDLPRDGGFFAWLKDLFGGAEEAKGINKPYAVYAHPDGRVFLTDTGWNRVLVFDTKAGGLEFWGDGGPLGLTSPLGITTDGGDGIWVSDGALKRVIHFDGRGRFVAALGREGELERPVGLAHDVERHRMYVVDTAAHQLVVYDTEHGAKVDEIGTRGSGKAEFNYPTNVALGPDGLLYVSDTMNFRVQVLERDGTFVRQLGGNCNGPGCTPRAKGVGVDSEGHVYVSDAAFSMFQLFDEQGRVLLGVGGPGGAPGMLFMPAGLYVTPDDHIWVADQLNRRVSEYEYLPEPAVQTVEAEDGGESTLEDAGETAASTTAG